MHIKCYKIKLIIKMKFAKFTLAALMISGAAAVQNKEAAGLVS